MEFVPDKFSLPVPVKMHVQESKIRPSYTVTSGGFQFVYPHFEVYYPHHIYCFNINFVSIFLKFSEALQQQNRYYLFVNAQLFLSSP